MEGASVYFQNSQFKMCSVVAFLVISILIANISCVPIQGQDDYDPYYQQPTRRPSQWFVAPFPSKNPFNMNQHQQRPSQLGQVPSVVWNRFTDPWDTSRRTSATVDSLNPFKPPCRNCHAGAAGVQPSQWNCQRGCHFDPYMARCRCTYSSNQFTDY